MGYEKIKELIEDVDAYYSKPELRELLQDILFICLENIKEKNEPSISDQTNR